MSRSRVSISAHALGVSAPEESGMESLIALDKERLIERHRAQVLRIYTGITQRAAEHRAEVDGLTARVAGLRSSEDALKKRVNHLMLVLLFCVGAVLYFSARDVACPVIPWIVKVAQ